jgi:23S rRNA (adenine2503-C2)-methyltransferase
MDLAELQSALGPAHPRFRAQQIYEAVYHQRVTSLDQITTLPKPLRELIPLGLPEIERVYDSTDGTRRYLLRLADGKTVESVWMPEGERATICISSQVGCPVDCKFCLTALLGLERSLTAGEIVGQVLRVAADQKVEPNVDRLNIVMMGQGEPLLNLTNVLKATRILTDQRGGAIAPRRMAVSTSGIIPKIVELGQAEIRPRLAISLNASHEEQRREIMPITRKYHLADRIMF